MKDIKILISSILILTAFFLGIGYERYSSQKSEASVGPFYINLVEKSNGFNIIKNSDSIHVLVNGSPFNSGSLTLK